MSPTTIATQRWRTCAVVMSDVSAGKNDPFISGQSTNTSAAFAAVTFDPNISSANVATAANDASKVKRWLPPRPGMWAG